MILILGIVYDIQFMLGCDTCESRCGEEGLIHGETSFPVSFTLITALILLMIGVAAIMSMALSRRSVRIGRRMAQT